MATRVVERARAKVNLDLRVLGRRADGYHEIESLVAFADVGDTVTVECGAPPGLDVVGAFAEQLAGANLLETVLERVRGAHAGVLLGRVTLEKALPVAAGLGGGSADAGALLRVLQQLNPGAPIDWRELAAGLGADVPVCFASRCALMHGTGAGIVPLPRMPPVAAVLVNPCVPVLPDKTRAVYQALGAGPLDRPQGVPTARHYVDAASLIADLARRGNDLAAPARRIMPAIALVEAALAAQPGCRLVRLSGSGPTVFGVFDTPAEAEAAAAIRRAHPAWWVVATMLR